jgi:hypothetical protein
MRRNELPLTVVFLASLTVAGTPQAPILSQSEVGPPSLVKSVEEAQETRSHQAEIIPPGRPVERAATEWWLMTFTGALVVVGLLQFLVYAAQARYMRRGLRISDANVQAAQRAAIVAERTLVLTQRPKLIVRNVVVARLVPASQVPTFVFLDGHLVTGQLYVVNVGGSDATIVDMGCWVEWTDQPLSMDRPYEGKSGNVPIRRTLSPGMSIPVPFQSERPMDESGRHLNTFKLDNAWHLYVLGWIEYKDALGLRRRTAFCRTYNPDVRGFEASWNPDYEHAE